MYKLLLLLCAITAGASANDISVYNQKLMVDLVDADIEGVSSFKQAVVIHDDEYPIFLKSDGLIIKYTIKLKTGYNINLNSKLVSWNETTAGIFGIGKADSKYIRIHNEIPVETDYEIKLSKLIKRLPKIAKSFELYLEN